MVAVIKTGCSLRNIFNYNENKVKQGVAVCIGERNYPVDADKMNLTMKLNRLQKQLALNENVKRNSVHISLNFDPSETHLSKEKLVAIADSYMQQIGFQDQPCLIYQHHDAGHPHIHLVSIKVREDGSRIDMHNIGRNQSEKARKEIEQSFGLVVAEGRKKTEHLKLKPIEMGKVHYGKIQSKKAMTVVLSGVLSSYKYTSMAELNAVLQQYNILADRGNENSRVFKAKGLVYRILGEDGKPIGVPIKASDFSSKPTLKFLESRFTFNSKERLLNSSRVKSKVDLALLGNNISLDHFKELLRKEGINVVFRKSDEGQIYGITYVDHTTKCVFNGSTLGKQYSAKAIQQRSMNTFLSRQNKQDFGLGNENVSQLKKIKNIESKSSLDNILSDKNTIHSIDSIVKVIETLIEPENIADYIPGQLKGKRRKKRKRKGQSDNL